MAYFQSPYGILVDYSGSGFTTGSAINFVYQSSSFLNPLISGSIGSVKTRTKQASKEGVKGEVFIELSNNDLQSFSEVARFVVSGSSNIPQFGIGFPEDEELLSQFDVKSVSNNKKGTEIILRSGRPEGTPVQAGDVAGTLVFTIDSGSYRTGGKEQFIQSSSIGSIDAVVTEVGAGGVQGHLRIKTARSNRDAERAIWTMGYGADEHNVGNFGSTTTGSVHIVRDGQSTSVIKPHLSLTDENTTSGTGETQIGYITGSITGNTGQNICQGVTQQIQAVFIDYHLTDSAYTRTGQIIINSNGTNATMTDTSAPAIGKNTAGEPTFSITSDGAALRITNGDGLDFRFMVRRF